MDEQYTWSTAPKVTIPVPMMLSRNSGIHAKKADENPITVRITQFDIDLLDREASELGLPRGTFIRWCAVQVARELAFKRTGVKPKGDL